MKIEVRATGLRAMQQKRGLTQRQLAKDLNISQNYIPGIESGTPRAGPELMATLVKYFRCDFWDLFEVYVVNGENRSEQRLLPARDVRG